MAEFFLPAVKKSLHTPKLFVVNQSNTYRKTTNGLFCRKKALQSLILVGQKNSGKTHFGGLLSKETGALFFDADEILLRRHRKIARSIKGLYQEVGEKRFRFLEHQVICSLYELRGKPMIIAVGGGAMLQEANVKYLQAMGTIVCLHVSLENWQKCFTSYPAYADSEEELIASYQKRMESFSRASLTWVNSRSETLLEDLKQIYVRMNQERNECGE